MVEIDLSTALEGRVANQEVDMLMIAGQVVWEKPSEADGPYYLNDATGFVPNSFTDGTPNIVTGHLFIFHNSGFVTGARLYDANSGAGQWNIGIREVDTVNGHTPVTGGSFLEEKLISATGAGLREIVFDDPVPVVTDKVYLLTRYNSTGYYVHRTADWSVSSHGAYTDGDPVYLPADNENISSIVTGWTSIDRSLFGVGIGDTVPVSSGTGAPYYGISPIFFKSL